MTLVISLWQGVKGPIALKKQKQNNQTLAACPSAVKEMHKNSQTPSSASFASFAFQTQGFKVQEGISFIHCRSLVRLLMC